MKRYNGLLFGAIGIILLAVGIAVSLPKAKRSIANDHFKGVRKIELKEATGLDGRWLPGGRSSNLDNIVLKNQLDQVVDLVNDKHDFKLVAVSSIPSKCKGIIETMSMVKKELANYISLESFAIFADSAANAPNLARYATTYNFDIQCLYARTYDEVYRLARYQLFLVLDRDTSTGVEDIVSDIHLLLVHNGKSYYIDGLATTAQEISCAILDKFGQEDGLKKIATEQGKAALNNTNLAAIAANTAQMEHLRQFDYKCGGMKGAKLVYK